MMTHLMLIDDNEVDRYIVNRLVTRSGVVNHFSEFDMGQKALDFLIENKNHKGALPQVILLDISMPVMSGFDFLDRFSEVPELVKAGICIVMLSSSLDPRDLARSEANSLVHLFLNKPLSPACIQAIDCVVDLAGSEMENDMAAGSTSN